jgi:hypothetical protein
VSAFPPRDRLMQVVSSLVRRLPEQFDTLLAAERFADGRGALERLSDPDALAQGAAAMAPEEASWMAELLLERWARVGPVTLDPAVAIVGPEDVWLSRRPRDVVYELATSGVEEDWTAQWTGDAQPDADGRQAVLTAHPPRDAAPATATMTVRLMGRAAGRRCILVATRSARLRRPVISLDDHRRRLVVRDHTGEPAAGVEVDVGGQVYLTLPGGLLELEQPLGEDAVVRVKGAVVT